MMNILEQEDIIKGLPDQALMREAQMPSGQVPQFLVVSEIQRRKDMRKRYSAERPQEGTVKDQILGEASMGIMGAMPPQMAMAPQMPQRMPQMPPQGIQQAMPTQMMSGGGIVRMFTGGNFLDSPTPSGSTVKQQIDRAIALGMPYADLLAFVSNTYAGRPEVVEYLKSKTQGEGAGMTLIEGDPSDDIRSRVPFGPPASQIYADSVVKQAVDAGKEGIGSMASAIGENIAESYNAPDVAARREALSYYANPQSIELQRQVDSGDITRQEMKEALAKSRAENPGFLDKIGIAATDTLQSLRDGFADFFDGPIVAPGGIGNVGTTRMFGGEKDAPREGPNQLVDRLIQDQIDLKGFNEGTFDGITSVRGPFTDNFLLDSEGNPISFEGEVQPTPNDAADPAQREAGKKKLDATRIDIGDATIPTGADAAAVRLSELQAMIDKQSAASSSAAKGAALIALGTSIMEGKTAQGGAKAGEILAKDAQTRGALQLEGAKLRLADARERDKLDIMRQDLINKLKITDRQSLMAALKSYEASITALTNDRTRLMTEEGQAAMRRLNEEQALLRSLLIPDVDLDKAGALMGGSQTPATKSFLDLPNK